MNSNLVVCDVETTGLDPENHEVWEVALIEPDGTEHVWRARPENLHRADEGALRVTRFYERIKAAGYREEEVKSSYPSRTEIVKRSNFWSRESRAEIAKEVATLTANKHLVGAVPWFDARFLTGFLRREGVVPAWHYHMVDVETYAAGYLSGEIVGRQHRRYGKDIDRKPSPHQPPWRLDTIAKELGIDVTSPEFEKHTALGDARLARAVYLAVTEGREGDT